MKRDNQNLKKIMFIGIKKLEIILIALLVIVFAALSCSKDEDEVEPKHPCDTIDVTYSGVVQPILEQNCYNCHGNGSTNGGVDLGSYEAVLVTANHGRLSGAINHEPGYTPMPSRNPQLDSCSIWYIDKWIDEGAPNN